MLVLDPSRRYSIAKIKQHEWMLMDGGGVRSCPPSPTISHKGKVGQYNEQILRIMQSLGIDQQKTMEVYISCGCVILSSVTVWVVCVSVILSSFYSVSSLVVICGLLSLLLSVFFFFADSAP